MHRPVIVVLASLLLAACVFAQIDPNKVELRLKVLYNNSRPVRNHTEVMLLNGAGSPMGQTFTDDSGNASFPQLNPGNYRIRIVDSDVEDNMSDVITLARREFSQFQMITVKLKAEAEAELKREETTQALVSALDLNVPPEAKKEFQRGAEAMEGGDNAGAQKRLERATDLYPKYALAYNHLGVVYMQTGQPQKGREAFEKAVALNDRYPSALVNLAKLRFQDRKLEDAETLLRKAVAADPTNVEALALLCDAEIVNGRLDDALGYTAKLHALPHKQYAAIHYIAAQALAGKGRPDDAVAQYALYLQEAPAGKGAEQARKEMARLKAQAVSR
jgi:tetratricopeptide (TPR) repeat protein